MKNTYTNRRGHVVSVRPTKKNSWSTLVGFVIVMSIWAYILVQVLDGKV